MGILSEARASDSPYVETVTRGVMVSEGSVIRPAETNWHLILVKVDGGVQPLMVGPLTASGVVTFRPDVELLWIKFKLGTFMPHQPPRHFVDSELILPGVTRTTFWLKDAAWQFPDYENADTFVERLVRAELLAHDPMIGAVLEGDSHDLSPRTVRHRFLRATGLTQTHIVQQQRAQQAAALLAQGASILDVVDEAGYYDQPHLTRSLKKWIGYTPAQLLR